MKTLEYNSKRLAKRIRVLMKESSNVIVSPNTLKEEPKIQELREQEADKKEVHKQEIPTKPERMVTFHLGGVDVSLKIFVPAVDSFFVGF